MEVNVPVTVARKRLFEVGTFGRRTTTRASPPRSIEGRLAHRPRCCLGKNVTFMNDLYPGHRRSETRDSPRRAVFTCETAGSIAFKFVTQLLGPKLYMDLRRVCRNHS